MAELDQVVSTTLPRAVVDEIDTHVTSELSRAGVLRGAIMASLDTFAGKRITPDSLILAGFRSVMGRLSEIEALLPLAPAPATTTCGAGLAPTPESADALLAAGAVVLSTPSGVLLVGVTPDGEKATVALDLGSGHLELAADSKRVTTEVGLPEAFTICEVLEGALAQARRGFDRASGSHPRHLGGEARLDGLTLTCCSAGPDGCSLSMGGLTVRCGTLDLMRLSCELRALATRSLATALQTRKGLDSAWAATPGAVVEVIK